MFTQFEEWIIKQLVTFGGFSHKRIAATLTKTNIDNVNDSDVTAVHRYCSQHKLRVKDWRDGKSFVAKRQITNVTKLNAKIKKIINKNIQQRKVQKRKVKVA